MVRRTDTASSGTAGSPSAPTPVVRHGDGRATAVRSRPRLGVPLLRLVLFVSVSLVAVVLMASPASGQTAQTVPAQDGATQTSPVPATTTSATDPGFVLPPGVAPEQTPSPVVSVPAVEPVPDVPDVGVSINSESGGLTTTVTIILLLTIGAVAPSIVLLTTSFTRFVIVLGLTRNALGTQQVPPTQVLTGLALFLTFFVMAPILSEVNDVAIQPLLAGELDQGQAFDAGFAPLQEFMLAQTDDSDLRLFIDMRGGEEITAPEDVPPSILIPAFVLSELRTAFVIGFVIFIPFLVIDLVVSSVLMSMGMVMLPPVFISLPLKLLLFVLVDGWALIIQSLVTSVNTT